MTSLYQYWSDNSSKWFNATPEDDAEISSLFEDRLINPPNPSTIVEWTEYVILYDQVLRHVNRHTHKTYTHPEDFIPRCFAEYAKYRDEVDDFQFMFMLMPIRHTHKYNFVMFVAREAWSRLEKTNSPQIKKFLEATYMRYIKLNDDMDQLHFQPKRQFNDTIIPILDCKHIPNILNNYDELFPIMKSFLEHHKIKPSDTITLSVSGGVDSMVCAYLLHRLKQSFIALHINYANRDECPIEEALLSYWFGFLNVPLYIRKIDEINRPKCMVHNMRDTYEDYTKQVRFSAYLNTKNKFVMLGHNKDDSIENIFSNIGNQSNIDNLYGMTPYSTQSFRDKDIIFLRPLLNTFKKDIYDTAINANIPYLVDSTPKWSQRGKFRDNMMSAIEKWDSSFIQGLFHFVDTVRDMANCIEKVIDEVIPTFKTINDVPIEKIYWRRKFECNKIFVSHSSLNEFIDKIKFLQSHPKKLILNVPNKVQLNKTTQMIITQRRENVEFILS